ncbi:MAG: hypothetical protein ACJAX3_001196 [Patiriisocius sp.]
MISVFNKRPESASSYCARIAGVIKPKMIKKDVSMDFQAMHLREQKDTIKLL